MEILSSIEKKKRRYSPLFAAETKHKKKREREREFLLIIENINVCLAIYLGFKLLDLLTSMAELPLYFAISRIT